VALERTPGVSWRPDALRMGWARGQLEVVQFARSKESVIFTIAFPVLMLALFGGVVGYDRVDGVPFSQYFTACMLAAGVFAAGFQSPAIQIAMERDKGVLRRLATTPLPLRAYLMGKLILAGAIALVTSALLLTVALLGYGASLPASAGDWGLLALVGVLGLVACALLGAAFSSIPRSARAAPAVITPLSLVIQVISGVFIPISRLPEVLQFASFASPLTWLVQGAHAAFGTPHTAPIWMIVIALAAWCAVGAALCRWTFRWGPR
jgi:ABC-2 type transport system permease protein